MTTPPSPDDGLPPRPATGGGNGLPPHLDPRGARRTNVPKVQRADRDAPRAAAPATATVVPERAGRSRGQRVGRVLSWIALTMSVVVLAVAGAGYALLRHYDGNITRINVFGKPLTTAQVAAAPHDAQNILLVGSDSRSGANGIGTGGLKVATGQRSDTMILAHLFGSSNKVEMVSFPRDSYVEIPAYTDPKTGESHRLRHDRINSALSEGGPALLIATIENLTKIKVDHYVQVDFTGFKTMVDKLGGVDVCLPTAAKDVKSGIDLAAGRHHINGKVALSFVRQRHGTGAPEGSDLGRIRRQQQVLGSLLSKVLSAGTLANPLKLNGFLNAATSSLEVDEKLTTGDMRDLALRLRNFSSKGVLFTTIPIGNDSLRTPGGALVLGLDEAKDEALFDALRRDVAPGSPAAKKPVAAAKALTVQPASVRVRVYNGSGVAGLGRRAFNDLSAVGFTTTGAPSNRGTGATQTIITYGPSRADSAKTLAAALPGSVTRLDPALTRTLEVVVGSGYTAATSVTVSSTPGSTPSPAPVKVRSAAEDLCSSA